MTLSLGTIVALLLVGLAIGVVGGMLGIGGGILVIPALVVLFKQPHETAVGTSLAMLLPPIGIFAFLEYHRHGNVNVPMAICLACGFAVGAYFGGRLVNSGAIPRDALRLMFAFFLLYVAGNILFHSDPRVWAMIKTASLLIVGGASYTILRLIGRRMEKRLTPREMFASALRQPLRPDYEI
ncbi:MAG: uncharacterized protein QOF78_2044 [Phycisphaerales bacterium]|jgi:uncharacterized membrane protein YfcA|nr:uncharacterized protein [Phycisphaerales bacterium]